MTSENGYPTANEGFRDVCWGTRHSEIPWRWSDDGFGQMCFVREDEDFEVFGVGARALTYTFRNSIFYGVRIDFAGVEQSASRALADCGGLCERNSVSFDIIGTRCMTPCTMTSR